MKAKLREMRRTRRLKRRLNCPLSSTPTIIPIMTLLLHHISRLSICCGNGPPEKFCASLSFWVGTKFRYSASIAAADFFTPTFPFLDWLVILSLTRWPFNHVLIDYLCAKLHRLSQGSLSDVDCTIHAFSMSLFLTGGEIGVVESWLYFAVEPVWTVWSLLAGC